VTDAEYQAVHAHAEPVERTLMELSYRTLQRLSDELMWTGSNLVAAGVLSFKQRKTGAQLRVGVSHPLRQCFDQVASTRKKPLSVSDP
jgi:hypothetical protein